MALEIIFNPLAQLQRAKKLNSLIRELNKKYLASEKTETISPIEIDNMLKFYNTWSIWYNSKLDSLLSWIEDNTSTKLSQFENQFLRFNARYMLLLDLYKQEIAHPYKRRRIIVTGDLRPDPFMWSSTRSSTKS